MNAALDEFDLPPPDAALLSPEVRTFLGKPLAPYSFGRRIVSRSVLRDAPDAADEVWTLSIIFILSLDEGQARAALYDVKTFKADLGRWIDQLTPAKYAEAVILADAILKEAKAADVNTVAEGSPDLKKKLTPPERSNGSAESSAASGA